MQKRGPLQVRQVVSHRTRAGLEGRLPEPVFNERASPLDFASYRWQWRCLRS